MLKATAGLVDGDCESTFRFLLLAVVVVEEFVLLTNVVLVMIAFCGNRNELL